MPKGVYSRNTQKPGKKNKSGKLGTPINKLQAASTGVNTNDVIDHLTKQRDRIDNTIQHLRELKK